MVRNVNMRHNKMLDISLYDLVSIQVANHCFMRWDMRTLADLQAKIDKDGLFKVPSIPWLFRFGDEDSSTWLAPVTRRRYSKSRPYLIGIGPKSWKIVLGALDAAGYNWRGKIVNRVTYNPCP